MIKSATDKITQDFQAQIQDLQSKIPTVPVKHPGASEKTYANWEDFLKDHEVKTIPDVFEIARAGKAMDEYENKYKKRNEKIANRITERLKQNQLDKEINNILPELFGNLNVKDDPMDTSNLIREIATDDDEYTLQLVRKKK
jgi:hypothetical protein